MGGGNGFQEGEYSILRIKSGRGVRSKTQFKTNRATSSQETVKVLANSDTEIGHLLKGRLGVWWEVGLRILCRVLVTQHFVQGNGTGSREDVIRCASKF